MEPATTTRWFDYTQAFDNRFFVTAGLGIGALLLIALLLTTVLSRLGRIGKERSSELFSRTYTWVALVIAIGAPLFFGAFWTILGLLFLSIFCYREFARITGLFRNYLVSIAVVIGIAVVFFAVLDHWYNFFAATSSLGVILIVTLGVLSDRPHGYLQRVALAVLAFLMFGVSLGHVAYIANDPDFRSLILLFLIAVELNDVFAYLAGNLFGKRRLAPQTSPNKTIEGSLGAVVGTTLLIYFLGGIVFEGTAMGSAGKLIALGIIVSVTGQLGDLVISSVKRDLGIKDTGNILPGHGGILDRFDSLLLAGPAYFHFIGYFNGFGLNEPTRIFRGIF
ncbi:phosphatidate cytidylyltransferase [Verrucomicrobiales bacterium BCK34]|nr:phosphatidate cytidylyltransferase [Verrucomicrobiales bacterium BCK34]